MAEVFLSYRHENDTHRERVRGLGQRLRDAGIDVVLDQFFLDVHAGGPDEGWPRLSKRMAGKTERVLIIGSPGWFRCYEGTELPGTGLGASAETVVINQRLYNVAGVTGAIRIAHFDLNYQKIGYVQENQEDFAPLRKPTENPSQFSRTSQSSIPAMRNGREILGGTAGQSAELR